MIARLKLLRYSEIQANDVTILYSYTKGIIHLVCT